MLRRLRAFLDGMAGRIFAILCVGMIASALAASALAGLQRAREVAGERADRIADRIGGALASRGSAPGARLLDVSPAAGPIDTALTASLRARSSGFAGVVAYRADHALCRGPKPPKPRGGPKPPKPPPGAGCFAVRLPRGGAAPLWLAIEGPPEPPPVEPIVGPVYLGVLGATALGLALVVARMAARPIARLGKAATVLSRNLDAPALALTGPHDVRSAIAAFNAMQADLKGTLAERTHMLAAISHDLRTPLTRQRLRLEAVADEELRDKLIGDTNAMSALIEEGLELARLSHSNEAIAPVDVGALLQSIAEDAEDMGQAVTYTPATRVVLATRPSALRRIVVNLVDNAVRYGGSAEITLETTMDRARIVVADRGPGIPEHQLEAVFDPFFRVEASRSVETGGTGLGLTIARMLVARIGGTLLLRNRPEGGLTAELTIGDQRRLGSVPAHIRIGNGCQHR